jgi:hypothetical protein
MSSPIRSFLNLLAFAAMAGVLLWREYSWQGRVAKAALAPAPAVAGFSGKDTSQQETELLSHNAVLQKQLTTAEAKASALAAEVQSLKAAVEAAKPPPDPNDLARAFAGQRGLAFDPAPAWVKVPLEAILDKIRQDVEAGLPAESAANRSRAALAMGFHSEPFEYRDGLVSLAQMSNGGFYEPAGHQFFYREDVSLNRADGREAFIGALAGALTRREGKAAGNVWDPPDDDVALAARSLISGDANAARVRFSIADQLNLNFDRSGAPTAPPPNYSAPVFLAEIWKFSQDKGSLFVEALTGKGGKAAVDAAYRRLPQSSAEILHPEELYLADPPFVPTRVELGETTVSGAAPLFVNTAGELGTYIALRAWLGMDEAAAASEGWAGDRYAVWLGEEGRGDHVFWKTVWRTDKDAREFFDQMRSVLMQRFSIPWREVYDAVPGQFRVDDPHRIIRLVLLPDGKTVTLANATDPAFAGAWPEALTKGG